MGKEERRLRDDNDEDEDDEDDDVRVVGFVFLPCVCRKAIRMIQQPKKNNELLYVERKILTGLNSICLFT